MDTNEKDQLLEALRKGEVTVTFTKVSTGEVRVMPCTLNPVVLEAYNTTNSVVDVKPKNEDVMSVWCTDKNGWRSFRLDSVQSWEVLGA